MKIIGLASKVILCWLMCYSFCAAADASIIDAVQLGDKASEDTHGFSGANTAVVQGGYNVKCRKIRPFTMFVDENYTKLPDGS